MKRRWLTLYLSLCILTGQAQQLADSVFFLPDSVKPFSLESFYQLVVRHHPVAKQAAMLSDVARQELRLARGNFDPKLETEFLLKHYNDSEYYRLFNGSVKLPTRSPVSPVVGLERNKGEHLNPENYISPEYNYQQMYAGILIPLGRGLLTDERRTALKQAELFGNMMEVEQVKMINKLLLDAAKDYWQWYYSYYNYRLASNATFVVEEIFRRVKINYTGGEAAPVDTIQSKIALIERRVIKQEAFVELKNATAKISTYLWDSLMNPVDLPMTFAPVTATEIALSVNTLEELMNHAKVNHPELRKANLKLEQLELERRLASEYMKPKLDVSYYMLNQPFNPEGFSRSVSWDENYKLGIDFSIPLFLRKERAKVAQTRLKISQATYDRDLATRQILNDINTSFNFLLANGAVLQQQQSMVANYYSLMNAEFLNLENGESDLFKINIQQEKLFTAQSKLIKVLAEYEKQKAILYWSAGSSTVTKSM